MLQLFPKRRQVLAIRPGRRESRPVGRASPPVHEGGMRTEGRSSILADPAHRLTKSVRPSLDAEGALLNRRSAPSVVFFVRLLSYPDFSAVPEAAG